MRSLLKLTLTSYPRMSPLCLINPQILKQQQAPQPYCPPSLHCSLIHVALPVAEASIQMSRSSRLTPQAGDIVLQLHFQ